VADVVIRLKETKSARPPETGGFFMSNFPKKEEKTQKPLQAQQ
jgi:hypothetical protein